MTHNRTIAILQARLRSTRLPGKVMYELAGMPIVVFILRRLSLAMSLDQVVLATGDGDENDILAQVVEDAGYPVFRGSENDVLARFHGAALLQKASVIVRVTGDCPFVDPGLIDAFIEKRKSQGLDFVTNVKPPTWPDGLDLSVFTMETLERAHQAARLSSEREHVVPWMWKHSTLEGAKELSSDNVVNIEDFSHMRWTIDEPADYRLARGIVDHLGREKAVGAGWEEILRAFHAQSHSMLANQCIPRDQGYETSLKTDRIL